MKNKTIKTTALIAGIVAIISVGGVMAYLTDTDSAVNRFKIAKVDIEETEPEWSEPEDPVTPNQTIKKDPTVVNRGDNEAFVFQKVSIPVANVVVAEQDGTRKEAADTELFNYTVNTGWYELGHKDVLNGEGKIVAREYLYAYGSETDMTVLAPEASTPALFDEVTFINVIEGSKDNNGNALEESTQLIDVNAYGIQISDLNPDGNGVGKTAPADVWAVYANQNSIQDVFNK